MRRFCILKLGTTFPQTRSRHGDFDSWAARAMGMTVDQVDVIHVLDGEAVPDLSRYAGVVATGSHAMVTDRLPWSEQAASRIAELVVREVPFFGICYGHQLLAHATGGRVGYLEPEPEVGTVEVRINSRAGEDWLLQGIPSCFPAHATHAQTVHELPPGAILLAASDRDPHHMFRVGSVAWGVQFHPEYTPDIMREYLVEQQLHERLHAVKDTPAATAILRRFTRL